MKNPAAIYRLKDPFDPEIICDILVRRGHITERIRREILAKKDFAFKKLRQKQTRQVVDRRIDPPLTIVDVIVSFKIERSDRPPLKLDEDLIFQVLAEEWGIEYKKIDPLKLDLNLVTTTLPQSFALKHLILPIARSDGILTLATCNPYNEEVLEDIARVVPEQIKTVISSKSDIIKTIVEFYGFKRSIAEAENLFVSSSIDLSNLEHLVQVKSADEFLSTDQHIVNAVNHLISYAFDQRASDIHIEPKREESIVRMRIDGVLHTVYKLPKNVHPAIVSLIKNLARLDMAEKRRPQDGRIKTRKGEIDAEIRVSTIPVAFGEKIVMRIMDPDILFQDLETLGFSSTDLIRFHKCIKKPHGIVLVCGPTGSGKSTTLYSALQAIYTPEVNITTIEDPIEMVNEYFNQIAVRPVLGITFSSILRNILRQDPDIIMIGEMRDLETAENAVQAALTGHLVLSTLHTNDAPSSIIRLLDLGVQDFLIKSTLNGVLSQRLVRKICNYCKESFKVSSQDLHSLGIDIDRGGTIQLYRGRGCTKCRNTGYHGRVGIYEVMPYSDALRKMTLKGMDLQSLHDQAKKEGMKTLRESAQEKMLNGKTTYQEVLRVTWEHE